MNFLGININSPSEIKNFLEERDLGIRKKWGQNFLIKEQWRGKIINLLPDNNNLIWEIGPGLAILTDSLLQRSALVRAFEIDPAYCKLLEEAAKQKDLPLKIVKGDFIKTVKNFKNENPDYIVGNLPYYSASSIIISLIENNIQAKKYLFTVQKEMQERMRAVPGQKNYAAFSVFCQSCFKISCIGHIPASAFYPSPDVQSSIVALEDNPKISRERAAFIHSLSRICFASRRKTLLNNLKNYNGPHWQPLQKLFNAFEEQGISLNKRAEKLSVDDFYGIVKSFYAIKN